jgi:glycosyltransferase involved in cell wall biosynthesis
MRILFLADGRSPITLNWLRYWIERGDDVYLASTFPCAPILSLKGLELVPVVFSGMASAASTIASGFLRGARTLRLRTIIRQWLGPLTLPRAARRLQAVAEVVRPDLIHAMRIPYEGMLAAHTDLNTPLVVSVWGNDFTLHAEASPWMRRETRRVLHRADALHTDCQRDIRLARRLGFPEGRPTLVIPGNGGIHSGVFFPPNRLVQKPVVVNPRGFRTYVRNDTFFRAIPLVLEKCPEAFFRCASMAGEAQALTWIAELGIGRSVELLPPRPHAEMADLYRKAQVLVSPSMHDGTPNSLLEGMACGCFPVAGDLESIREWVNSGENGLLVDPADPRALADAILTALADEDLRARAIKKNVRLIATRAEYGRCMAQAEVFYRQVLKR